MCPDQADHGRAPEHVPVLLHEVLEFLDLGPGLTVVDGTVGSGGHAMEIAQRIEPGGRLIGLDRDPAALERSAERLRGTSSDLAHASYSELGEVLAQLQLDSVDRVLVDLGLSSDQLADVDRGFSFESDGPLDMRFDPSSDLTAADVVNRWQEARMADAFYEFGEERFSRRIARRIVQTRPIRSTRALAELVFRCVPHERRKSGRLRIHPRDTCVSGAENRCESGTGASARISASRTPAASGAGRSRCGHFLSLPGRPNGETGVSPAGYLDQPDQKTSHSR